MSQLAVFNSFMSQLAVFIDVFNLTVDRKLTIVSTDLGTWLKFFSTDPEKLVSNESGSRKRVNTELLILCLFQAEVTVLSGT